MKISFILTIFLICQVYLSSNNQFLIIFRKVPQYFAESFRSKYTCQDIISSEKFINNNSLLQQDTHFPNYLRDAFLVQYYRVEGLISPRRRLICKYR